MNALDAYMAHADTDRPDFGCWGDKHGRNPADGQWTTVEKSPFRDLGLCEPCGYAIVGEPIPRKAQT